MRAAPPVDDATVERFERDGAVVVRGLLDRAWLEVLAAGVERNRANPGPWAHRYTDPDEAVGFWTDYVTWREVDEHRRVALESPLGDAARRLMRSAEARFFHEHVLVKEAGAIERTPWHHDQPYYCVDGDQNVSLWVALDPVPADAGMRFLAGSHRWGRWFTPRRFLDHAPYADAEAARRDGYELVPDVDAELAAGRHEPLSFDVEPGDVVAFHFRTLHDAPGNRLDRPRRAVSFRWVGDDATFATRPWEVSPPFRAEGLAVGGPLDGDPRFPTAPPSSRLG